MIVTAGSQFGALGAAIVAGVGVGLYADYTSAVEQCVRIERVHEPDVSTRALYDERYALYIDLIESMRPFWDRLAGTTD